MDEQIKELTKQVNDLSVMIARLDTKIDGIKDVQHKVEDHSIRLTSVESSAKQAHYRMDRIEKAHTWVLTTAGGAVLVAVVAFVIKGGLVK